MPASAAATVKPARTAREEPNERRTMPPKTTFFSIAKTARQTDSKLINEISKISTIVILSPRLAKWRELQTARRFGAETRILATKFLLLCPVPENGRLKSGYYCRFEGELSNEELNGERYFPGFTVVRAASFGLA